MIYSSDLIRAYAMGGVLAPTELEEIIDYAESYGNKSFHIGCRQDILFYSNYNDRTPLPEPKKNVYYAFEGEANQLDNIMTSYVSLELSRSFTRWVTESTYLQILDTFYFKPKLKINIVDPKQGLIPLYNGELNFIASSQSDYWYLVINSGQLQREYYPVLVHSYDIAQVSRILGKLLPVDRFSMDDLFGVISENYEIRTSNYEKKISSRKVALPYYEGVFQMNDGDYWLGIYYRKNNFSVEFMKELAALAEKTDIGKICLTPWNSVVVKGISKDEIILWSKLLGKYGINVRHSSVELNWYYDELNKNALRLKIDLIDELQRKDIRTRGLGFSLFTKKEETFTPILIQRSSKFSLFGLQKYDLYYSDNFKFNSNKWNLFKQKISKDKLADEIIELTKLYYDQIQTDVIEVTSKVVKKTEEVDLKEVHVCSSCDTIYDEEVGDVYSDIPKGVPFNELPADYKCYLCEADKSEFKLKELAL